MSETWTLRRELEDDVSCGGTLLDASGAAVCRTLERGLKGPHPRIEAGTYALHLRAIGQSHFDSSYAKIFGPLFRGMVELLAVPGRSDILIHCGNTVADSLGCVLVGQSLSFGPQGWEIAHSQAAFRVVYPQLLAALADDVSVQIKDIGE